MKEKTCGTYRAWNHQGSGSISPGSNWNQQWLLIGDSCNIYLLRSSNIQPYDFRQCYNKVTLLLPLQRGKNTQICKENVSFFYSMHLSKWPMLSFLRMVSKIQVHSWCPFNGQWTTIDLFICACTCNKTAYEQVRFLWERKQISVCIKFIYWTIPLKLVAFYSRDTGHSILYPKLPYFVLFFYLASFHYTGTHARAHTQTPFYAVFPMVLLMPSNFVSFRWDFL